LASEMSVGEDSFISSELSRRTWWKSLSLILWTGRVKQVFLHGWNVWILAWHRFVCRLPV